MKLDTGSKSLLNKHESPTVFVFRVKAGGGGELISEGF